MHRSKRNSAAGSPQASSPTSPCSTRRSERRASRSWAERWCGSVEHLRRSPFVLPGEPMRTLAALLLLSSLAHAAPKKIVTIEGITEYQLDNGLRVLLFPDSSKPTVTVNVTYFVGSRHEGYGETGMAHLLEHLMFKGTPKHDRIFAVLDKLGGKFNGTTWTDRTNYFETLPSTPENLKYALEMEADRMINSRISADDLKSEFSVVRNEFEMGENFPPEILEERMLQTAYLWHNYGKPT